MAEEEKLLVGLDIGHHSIKLIQLRVKEDGYWVQKLAVAPVPRGAMQAGEIVGEDDLVRAVGDLAEREGIEDTRVAASMAGEGVAVCTVWVPEMEPDDMQALLAWEGEQYLPIPLEDAHLDYEVQGEAEEEGRRWLQVVLVAARKSLVQGYMRVLAGAGLDPVVLDCALLALENGFEAAGGGGDNGAVALLDMGSQLTHVHLVAGELSLLSRTLPFGGDDFTRAIQEGLRVDREQAESIKCGKDANHPMGSVQDHLRPVTDRLTSDLERLFSVYRRQWPDLPLTAMVVSGGGARLQGLAGRLAEALGMPVETANPFARVSFSDEEFDPDFVASMAPVWAIALGLGVRPDAG